MLPKKVKKIVFMIKNDEIDKRWYLIIIIIILAFISLIGIINIIKNMV